MKPLTLLKDRRVWLVLAAVAVIAGLHVSGLKDYLSLHTLKVHRRELMTFVGDHFVLAIVLYVGVYIAAIAFSFPGALLLTVSGGFLFGALAGTLLSVLGATIGGTLSFLFARFIFGESALERFGPQAKSLAENIKKNAWSYLLVLRLVPLFPFFLVNLIPAFVGVRLTTYFLTTFFGIIPGTTVFSLAGAGLGRVLDKGEEFSVAAVLTPEIIAGLVGLALLSLAAIPIRKRFETTNTG